MFLNARTPRLFVLLTAHRESVIRVIYQPAYSRKGGELVVDRSGGRYISVGSDGIISFWTVDLQVRTWKTSLSTKQYKDGLSWHQTVLIHLCVLWVVLQVREIRGESYRRYAWHLARISCLNITHGSRLRVRVGAVHPQGGASDGELQVGVGHRHVPHTEGGHCCPGNHRSHTLVL